MVNFCYIDESGTAQIPGNTSHYVLCGVSIPVNKWKVCDKAISKIKQKYGLSTAEIHTGWIMRKYFEQAKIDDFDNLSHTERRSKVTALRKAEIFRVQKLKDNKALKQLKKTYKHTDPYIHLSYIERKAFLSEIAEYIGNCSFVRIFAECIDKVYFDPEKSRYTVDEQALEQLVSRFELYLKNQSRRYKQNFHGLLIHDNNETVCKKHTELMKVFHQKGTLWTHIDHIIETPMFVDSELTSMIQIADLCAIALRRYFENNDTELLTQISSRFDYHYGKLVGVRHYSKPECTCEICTRHTKMVQ